MKNLRIVDSKVTSNTVEIYFNQRVSSAITVRNFSLISETIGTPDVVIESAEIFDKKVVLNTRPLTYNSIYVLTAFSSEIKFLSRDQEYLLLEDGINNVLRLQGPADIDNPVFSYYKSYFKDNIYDIDNNDTVINKYLKGSSEEIVKLVNETNQVKSDRFLSYFTKDEIKTRGQGPFDRLNNEGAYLVTRVGLNPSSADLTETVEINPFNENVISLSQQIKFLTFSTQDENFFTIFDKNNLTFNLDKNLIKITSLKFTFINNVPNYEYDLSTLGYQLLESKYDDNSFTNLSLKSNQAKLSDNVLLDDAFDINNLFRIEIVYYINNLGKTIDVDTLEVFDIKKSVREEVPSIVNIFDTKYAPITNSDGSIPNLGGITILNVETFVNSHPAFETEIVFDLSNLPSRAGQYSVDYTRGKIYVFGSDTGLTGTGDIPPVITYNYKHVFKSEIDYVFDDQAYNKSSLNDLVALPNGSLINNKAFISYGYDNALTPGVDYEANLHVEVLNERIDNRYSYPNVFKTLNTPITGAFRIYNETSGEIYEIARYAGNKIYVAGNNSPSVKEIKNEKVNFSDNNETLIVSDKLLFTNTVYKIFLANTNIISKTQSGIGYNINSSAVFSDERVFKKEKYFNINLVPSLEIGEYSIDYINGIVYVAVDSLQNYNIGNVNYKYGYAQTEQKHITNILQISKNQSIGSVSLKNYVFNEIKDQQIEITNIDNQLTTDSSQVSILNISGLLTANLETRLFSDYQINNVMEYQDLVNNTYPVNFPYIYSDKTLTVQPWTSNQDIQAQFDGYQYFIDTNIKSDFINSNFVYSISAKDKTTQAECFHSLSIVNDQYRVLLSSGSVNQIFELNFSIIANNLTRFVVDYIDGEIYINYEYLADEIVVSYEYGDNVIDFRDSEIISGTEYYVSYKAGTLREGLNNFASLLRVPELQVFDTEYDRESFRDAVMGGLSSFLLGSTKQAINNLVNSITHIVPEIKETLFEQWILGDSFLHSNKINLKYSSLEKGKFFLAPKFTNTDSLTIPFSSNFNLEEGTFSTWFKSGVDVTDNSSTITFSIKLNGSFIDNKMIFLGAQEYHPDETGVFSITKNSIIPGKPQINKRGLFIYLDKINNVEKYNIVTQDYVFMSENIEISVSSNDKLYAVFAHEIRPDDILTTKQNSFTVKVPDTTSFLGKHISFVSSQEKYVFDTNDINKNRMSLFFDSFGYLTFRVYDKKGKLATLSHNCSSWKTEDLHHIGVGWKLNTFNNQDELHLFVDGQEVFNVNYWGEKYESILENNFRDTHLDRYIGQFTSDIVGSNDLAITANSNIVTSSVSFSAYNINPGDIIYINEVGFNPGGYSISNVNGNELTLTVQMPISFTDGNYSVNRGSLTVGTKDWLYPNVCVLKAKAKFMDFGNVNGKNLIIPTTSNIEVGDYVYINNQLVKVIEADDNKINFILNKQVGTGSNIPVFVYFKDLVELNGIDSTNPDYYIEDDIVVITNNVLTGELVFISTLGINSERNISKYYSWTHDQENVIKTRLPTPINLDTVKIKRHLLNQNLSISNTQPDIQPSQYKLELPVELYTSFSDTGRSLDISLSGNNIDFTSPSVITITGVNETGIVSETLNIVEQGVVSTTIKFFDITNIDFHGYYIDAVKNYGSLQITEHEDIFVPEQSDLYPTLKYSYVIKDGFNLSSDGYTLNDPDLFFSYSDKDNYLYINEPLNASGIFKIIEVVDNHTIIIDSIQPVYTSGKYQVLRTTGDKTGFQNGYFTFEQAMRPGQKYFISKGDYTFDYHSKLNLDYESNDYIKIGNSFDLSSPLNGTLDQIKIDNILLKDVRVGEVSVDKNITSEFNSLKPLKASESTLFLLQDLVDVSKFYDRNKNKKLFYTNHHINENFGDSIHVIDPIKIDNLGIFTPYEGTISFWISTEHDSFHENRINTIFDFYGSITEEVESTNRKTIILPSKISKVLKVEILGSNKDYYTNGSVNISLDDTITETVYQGLNSTSVTVSKPIQQVVSITYTDVFGSMNLFGNGFIEEDQRTIRFEHRTTKSGDLTIVYKPLGISSTLNKQVINLGDSLPNDVMKVKITYLPENFVGDRMSLYKDRVGNLVYKVIANGETTSITTPINWISGSWHKVKLSYSMKNTNKDTITMWIDGYQQHNTFDHDTTYINSPYDGYTPANFGNVVNYNNISKNIKFSDSIESLTFGAMADLTNRKQFAIDDIKFTNRYNEGVYFLGERFDLSYSKNINTVIPSVNDLYTTYMLSGKSDRKVTENFSYLRNKASVNNDFYLNIFDSFDIVKSNDRVKLILEKLIKLIKPASSRVYIKYIG